MENEQKTSRSWLNTVNGKAFLAGLIMPIGCVLTSTVVQPLAENADVGTSLLSLAGLLLITAGVFAAFQLVLKRRGFEGFALIERNSLGKGSAYLLFFTGMFVSIAITFVALFILVIITNLLPLP